MVAQSSALIEQQMASAIVQAMQHESPEMALAAISLMRETIGKMLRTLEIAEREIQRKLNLN